MVTPSRLPDGQSPEVSAEIAVARAAGLYAGVAYAVGNAAGIQVQGAAGWDWSPPAVSRHHVLGDEP